MKDFKLVFITVFSFLTVILVQGCSKEFTGQYPVDSVAPDEVSSIEVVNFSGGSTISYQLPEDDDLLYVKAIFERNGKKFEQKSSVFGNSITLHGFGKSEEHKIILMACDRSGNCSKKIDVSIRPLDSPIYGIFKSVNMVETFGGVSVSWSNPEMLDVVLTVLTHDNQYGKDELYEAERFYTSTKDGVRAVRGFTDDFREFGYFIKDQFGNSTDTVFKSVKPIYEVELNKSLFKRWNPPGIPYVGSNTAIYAIEVLWDKIISNAGFNNVGGLEFTFDMGQMAKLSRVKVNSFNDTRLIYNSNHPKRFQIWGADNPNVDADFSKWTLLGEFISSKPSGLPLGIVSQEDVQYAHVNGEEFEFSPDVRKVRYLRVVCLQTWGNDALFGFDEMTLYGGN